MSSRRIFFGNNSGMSSSRKNLLEFKAGKMTLKSKMVHPDKRKGSVYLHQTDDSLMHFCWKDRSNGAVEDDLIIFPDDAEYKKVSECKTGRVFLLKFKSSNRKFFFWMQESKTDKDEEYCTKINDLLNNPPAPGSNASGGSSAGGLPSEIGGDGEFQNILNNMNQQQLMQLFGGMGGISAMSNILGSSPRSTSTSQRSFKPDSEALQLDVGPVEQTWITKTRFGIPERGSKKKGKLSAKTESSSSTTSTPAVTQSSTSTATTTTAATTTTSSSSPSISAPAAAAGEVRVSDLRNILSSLNVPSEASNSTSDQNQTVDLAAAVTSETIQPLLSNAEALEHLVTLAPQTSSSNKSAAEEIKGTVQSPQFQQAMSMFIAAFQSGQLGPIMHEFDKNNDVIAAAYKGDMESFIKALQDSAQNKPKKEEDGNSSKKPDKDDDEGMSLD
ncbi:Proteasomal ubiquitin receptor ADRM1 [Nymphon striatum]|nr:Proteasomal ubiquitin receptor ADRM1 [Nymphon striatum]